MRKLKRVVLVQFFLFESQSVAIDGPTAFLGANGAGKTTLLDAIQIVMVGADKHNVAFNSQSRKKSKRSFREYCLGAYESGTQDIIYKRPSAQSYITLVFAEDDGSRPISVGVCIEATKTDDTVLGRYVLRGVALDLPDHIELNSQNKPEPIAWDSFQERQRALLGASNALFEDSPDRFLAEMFRALKDGGDISLKAYRTAFKNAQVRDVPNVDSFVRDHIVEQVVIDRTSTRQLLKALNDVRDMIREAEQQLTDLDAIRGKYTRLRNARQREASTHIVEATLDWEHEAELIDDLKTQIEDATTAAAEHAREAQAAEGEAAVLDERHRQASVRLEADAAYQRAKTLEAGIKAKVDEHGRALQVALAWAQTLSFGLKQMQTFTAFSAVEKEAKAFETEMGRVAAQLRETPDQALATFEAALKRYRPVLQAFNSQFRRAEARRDRAETQAKESEEALRTAADGRRVLSGNVRAARAALQRQGIEAVPVCETVQVSQPEWRGIVETFLGSQREALRVPGGSERKSMALLGQLARKERIYDVTVVNPAYVSTSWSDPENNLVGSLLEGTDPIALAYLRQQVSGYQQVRNESELDGHAKALSPDGGQASGGGMRMREMLPAARWLLGEADESQRSYLERELEAANRELQDSQRAVNALKPLRAKLPIDEKLEELLPTLRGSTEELTAISADLAAQRAELASLGALPQSDLQAEVDRLKDALTAARRRERDESTKKTEQDSIVKLRGEDQQKAAQRFESAKQRLAEARTSPGASEQAADELREEIENRYLPAKPSREDAVAALRSIRKTARDFLDRDTQPAQTALTDFLRRVSRDFQYLGDYGDFAAVIKFADDNYKRINEHDLRSKMLDADLLVHKMQEAFRTDVIRQIQSGITTMKTRLDGLNDLLATARPFSNDERYKFVWTPKTDMVDVVKFIVTYTDGTDLFSENAQLPEKLRELIEFEALDRDSPLDDFRTMYAFDIEILVDGKQVGTVTRRMGRGSNGEHLTAFYVILAVGLAKALRLDDGTGTGAGVMLLDEAYAGMDLNNSLLTSKFIESLGLQTVMAAPDDAWQKMLPLTRTQYYLERYGAKLHLDANGHSDQARSLAVSDYPQPKPKGGAGTEGAAA